MALKTGYKVKGKEIILDDYSEYTSDDELRKTVQNRSCKTLDNYYKGQYKINYADGETEETDKIKASYFVEDKGQIPAELPGDNYYKAPSGAQKFALYGTNTVGGWINGKKSTYWAEFGGNTDNFSDFRTLYITFDGTKLKVTENDEETILRTYKLDDETPLTLDTIKVWCYMVGAGGGGIKENSGFGGGGGGGAAVISVKLNKGDKLKVNIPPKTNRDAKGGDTELWQNDTLLLYAKGGEYSVKPLSGGEGGTSGGYPGEGQTMWTRDGGKGGNCARGGSYDGSNVKTIAQLADYYGLWENTTNSGGTGFTIGDAIYSGGGASGFPGGRGGYITLSPSGSGKYVHSSPGPGGGGCLYSFLIENSGTGGPGAFWILHT